MKHVSKTTHVDERGSFAGSLVTIFAGQGARAAESKTTREQLPGKSRVGRILLNDNHSQDRLLDMKLADIHQMRRKTETFISHQQKTFVAKMEKRQETWVREHTRFSSGTNLVMPPGERKVETPREAGCAGDLEEGHNADTGEEQGGDGSTKLPAIAYLTETTDITPRDGSDGESCFLKPVEPHERAPIMFMGLPPIGKTKQSGFQPNGNIDEMFDDRAMRKSLKKLPPWKTAEGKEGCDSMDPNKLPAINSAGDNVEEDGRETKMSAALSEGAEGDPNPTPLLVLSRSLPRIQVREPATRKLRARRSHQSKSRRRRKIPPDTAHEMDNPLGDERFVKLHELLANDVVADHETRDISAIASGLLAAKRFGRHWSDSRK